MRHHRRVGLLLGAVCALAPARLPADQPHHFVLLEPGNERWYHGWSTSGDVAIHEVVTHADGGVCYVKVERASPYPMSWVEAWAMDAAGDVWRCNPENPADRSLFLDYPLTPGKTWGEDWGPMGYHWFTVQAPEVVDTVFGPLPCVRVTWVYYVPGYPSEHDGWYLFNDGHGLVESVYRDGYHVFQAIWLVEAVIGAQQRTWSQVKELFR